MTLVELVVATITMTLVVAGVLAAELAMHSANKQVSDDVKTHIMTRALENYIRQAVRRVHGDISAGSATASGISINTGTRTICFREDVQISGVYTPQIYTDDNWHCFTLIVNPGVSSNVYSCDTGTSPGTCTAAGAFSGNLVSDQFTSAAIPAPVRSVNSSTGDFYFDMYLVNRKDPSAGAAVSGTTLTGGTVDNPQTVLHFRQSPSGF